MQRWAAIAAAAQTLAQLPVTPLSCARTLNEILDEVYCSFAEQAPQCVSPTLISASINGDEMTLVFSEAVDGGEGFTGTVAGVPATYAYASGTGTNTLILTSTVAAAGGDVVTLDYAPGDVTNANGCPLEAILDFSVTNATPTESLWQSQALEDDFFDGSSSQYISQGIRNTLGAVTLTKIVGKVYGTVATASVKCQIRTLANGGGTLIGETTSTSCATSQVDRDFVFASPLALTGDFFLNFISADNAFRARIKSGDPYEGTSYAGWQGASVFTGYDLKFEVWKQ